MDKILVIEDDHDVRRNIVDLLEMAGYKTREASDGVEALAVVKTFTPDLIISDIMMPRMDGYSLLREFQNDSTTSLIPFIFLSAKMEMSDIRKGMNDGADDYLIKPYKANELLQAVSMRLKKKKRIDQTLKETALNISLYVPHELRTPLVAILGFTDILMEDFDSIGRNEILEMLEKIKKSSKRLHRTIEKFLMYTQLELLEKDEAALSGFLNSNTQNGEEVIKLVVLEKFQNSGRQHDFKFNLKNARVKIAEDHLKYIIDELIENALKFSPPGSIIDIEAKLEDDLYNIEITDHGIGMTNEQIGRVSPFIQHKREVLDQKGNGLGLVIVKKIASIYKGRFSINGEVNKYTKVSIGLPLY